MVFEPVNGVWFYFLKYSMVMFTFQFKSTCTHVFDMGRLCVILLLLMVQLCGASNPWIASLLAEWCIASSVRTLLIRIENESCLSCSLKWLTVGGTRSDLILDRTYRLEEQEVTWFWIETYKFTPSHFVSAKFLCPFAVFLLGVNLFYIRVGRESCSGW